MLNVTDEYVKQNCGLVSAGSKVPIEWIGIEGLVVSWLVFGQLLFINNVTCIDYFYDSTIIVLVREGGLYLALAVGAAV